MIFIILVIDYIIKYIFSENALLINMVMYKKRAKSMNAIIEK
mgnify:CR=1 FL=1